MVKLLILGLIMVCVIAGVGYISYCQTETPLDEEPLYQGPVPEGYNLTHFSKTGETIREVIG